jgi:hypothetical protein
MFSVQPRRKIDARVVPSLAPFFGIAGIGLEGGLSRNH